MCTGTLYWANIGRLVYGAAEHELAKLCGDGNEENFTLSLPCRDVVKAGQKKIEIWGPVEGLQERIIEASDVYWKPLREGLGK